MGTVTEVVVGPGGVHFSGGDVRVRTLLGSCVAITVWHPRARIGGMCHFVVPSRSECGGDVRPVLDGRYGDEAMRLLQLQARAVCTDLADYEVRIYGGGNQFAGGGPAGSIGVSARNIDAAQRLAGAHGLRVLAFDVGGTGARTIVLDLPTGIVTSSPAGNGTSVAS